MKTIISNIYTFFYEAGKIRAAMTLSRLGRHEEAKYVLTKGKI